MKKFRKNNKGFSLVELIVVIAIMAVLVGVLAPQFLKYVESSRQSTDLQNVQSLKSAVEVEVADNENVATVTIVVTAGASATATANLADSSSNAITLSATENSVDLKSDGWKAVTYTYNLSTYTWTSSATNDADATNTKGGTNAKCMNSVFD